MDENKEILKRFYDYKGHFYILVREGGVFVVESPTSNDKAEAVLRIFMDSGDAFRYKDQNKNTDSKVMKTTLVGLWSLLRQINTLSVKQYKAPVRVDVSIYDEDFPITVDVIHSKYSAMN